MTINHEPMQESKWYIDQGGNYILDGDEFYISFQPAASLFFSDQGQQETALCKDDEFYILNGDWRDEYQNLLPQGFDKCLEFFNFKKDKHGSSWSS
jgi:hypothetical protein